MVTDDTPDRPIKTANTVFDIVEIVSELDHPTLTEISDEAGMSKSTVKYHLDTLLDREYLARNDGEYSLSFKFLEFGIRTRSQTELYETARPELKRLSEETDGTSWLLVEEHGRSVHLDKVDGKHATPSRARVGERTNLHDHSGGKVILAFLPEARVDEIIEQRGLPKRTENTIVTRDELMDELETIRSQGYAVNDNEYTEGLRAVSAPILKDGELLGAVGLSDASHRMQGEKFEKTIPDLLMGAADSIVLSLKYGQTNTA